MKSVRIILVDDHAILRAGLKAILARDPLLQVVAQVPDGEELLLKLKTIPCDLVILDLAMPKKSGLAVLEEMRHLYPAVKILVLTMYKDQEHFKAVMKKGAQGYLLKEDAHDQFILAVKAILRGRPFISPAMNFLLGQKEGVSSVGEPPVSEILTNRERQILKYVASGLANKNIAARLNISIRTVEAHRCHLTDKLKIKSVAGLVKYALAQGLVSGSGSRLDPE